LLVLAHPGRVLKHRFACIKSAAYDCRPLSFPRPRKQSRAWGAKFYGEIGGATGCRGTRTDFPSARRSGDRHLLARGGKRKLLRYFHTEGLCLELPYLQYNTNVTSSHDRKLSTSFQKPSSLSFPHCPSGLVWWAVAKFTCS
jgi:hypothetical protein